MSYLLDTNACIHYLNGTDATLAEHILEAGPRALALSVITVAELYFGAARSSRAQRNRARVEAFVEELMVLDFTPACAEAFARVKAKLLAGGTPISDFDIAIASTALHAERTVVSDDRDMRRVRGLRVVSWTGIAPA